jgi:hypothetical protein
LTRDVGLDGWLRVGGGLATSALQELRRAPLGEVVHHQSARDRVACRPRLLEASALGLQPL